MTNEEIIREKTEEVLGQLHIKGPVSVKHQDDAFYVLIEGEDLGSLIGYHGEGLYALQHILSLLVAQKVGSWLRLFIDIGGWRAAREETLIRQAHEVADRVVAHRQSYIYEHLEPAERRVIHLALAERSDVKTGSEGEGRNRHLIVAPVEQSTDTSPDAASGKNE